MIVYAVLGSFQLLPLVKGRLVVFPNLVPKGFSVWNQTRILFVFCSCIEDVACRRRKRGFRRREKGRASGPLFYFALFSPSLPFLCLLHSLPLLFFVVWKYGKSGSVRPPATCQLTRNMRVSHACGCGNTDHTHNVEKSENRTPRVICITFYFLDPFYCSTQLSTAVVPWSLEMAYTKFIHYFHTHSESLTISDY